MKYCLLILSALLVISSCTKTEEPVTRQDILRAERWALDTGFVQKKWKMDGDGVPADINIKESYPEPGCRADDYLVFREGSEGAHVPGEVTCSINETAEIEFKWGVFDNDSKIYIYDAKEYFGTDVNARFVEFYDDKFAIEFSTYKDKNVTFPDRPSYWVTDTTIYTLYFKVYVEPAK